VTFRDSRDANSSEQHRWLVAAFKDESFARRAATDAETSGTDVRDIRIGNSLDALASVEAEMREELDHTGAGLVIGTGLGAIAGIVTAVPFAAFEFGGLDTSARMLVLGAVGLVFGALLGAFLGGMFGPKRPTEQLAASKATMLAVPDSVSARRALLHARPTRVDVFGAGGFLLGTLPTDAARPD
jgi:hypothetical protein